MRRSQGNPPPVSGRGSGPPVQDMATMRAWEDFVSGQTGGMPRVRDMVVHSWGRCRDSRVDVQLSSAPSMDEDRTALLRQSNRDLLQAAAETLAEAGDLLTGTGSLMLITDAGGVVLDVAGDHRARHAGRDIALWNGGRWAEDSAGTNGIGTALVLDRPVLVHAAEHYCEGIKGWSCAGAPIHDPVDGSIVGLLDVSALKHDAAQQLLALAVMSARRIERTLARQTEAEHARLLESCVEQGQRHAQDGLIALDGKGRILYVSQKAAHILRHRHGVATNLLQRGIRILNLGARGEGPLPELPPDWVKPLSVEGRECGTLLVIPAGGPAAPPVRTAPPRARPPQDESDGNRSQFDCIAGISPAIRDAVGKAARLAPLNVPVLIEGETGVGKELFARAIHGHSSVAQGPFIAFNCGAVSKEMLASELFGYVKGAFTGASSEGRMGRFEQAHGGTLCLDEIGEMSLDLQPYLLRVLEEGVVYRVGDNVPRRVNVRVLAMTNRNLRSEVAGGRFRLDLYHRLSVTGIHVPPLRDRQGDLDFLIDHFNRKLAEKHGRPPVRLTGDAMEMLRAYAWPGNVRELRNMVERALLLSVDGEAGVDCLPEEIGPRRCLEGPSPKGSLENAELRTIENAIRSSGGNLSSAAQILGISRSTLYRKMSQYGLMRALPPGMSQTAP